MTDSIPTDVLGRISKLLALAEGKGAAPNEAAVAAAKAVELMERHRIDRATVEGFDDDDPIQEHDEALYEMGSFVGWVGALAKGVATTQGCDAMLRKNALTCRMRLVLIGRSADVAVARHLFVYLHREIDRLARKALALGLVEGRSSAGDYRTGATAAVLQRLEQRKRDVRGEAPATAIVLLGARDAEVADFVARKYPDMQKGIHKAREARDHVAAYRGFAAGRDIPLHDAIEDGSRRGGLFTAQQGRLVLREEAGGPRYYLLDRPIAAGAMLELHRDGQWVRGRYEWSYRPGTRPLFFDGGLPKEIAADALLRWPGGEHA